MFGSAQHNIGIFGLLTITFFLISCVPIHEGASVTISPASIYALRDRPITSLTKSLQIEKVQKKSSKHVEMVQQRIRMGRIKAGLSVLCGVCIGIEMFEDALDGLPNLRNNRYLSLIRSRTRVSHGVLLLTMTHLIHNLFDLFEILDHHSELKEDDMNLQESLPLFASNFDSEEAAARAYDEAAIKIFGHNAYTNFVNPSTTQRTKQSRFKGVIWDCGAKCWKVDATLFLRE